MILIHLFHVVKLCFLRGGDWDEGGGIDRLDRVSTVYQFGEV